jgi:spermidine synthase
MIGMALNLLLLLNFQETFGSIYEMLGAMTAVSMLGLALGAMVIVRITQKHKIKFLLLVVLSALVSVVLLLPQLLHLLLRVHSMPFTLIITMFCGGLIGMLFGIVNRLYSYHTKDLGSIYAYDVLGSSVGALIACSVLLPVLGIQEMTMFLSLVLVPAIIAAIFTQRSF